MTYQYATTARISPNHNVEECMVVPDVWLFVVFLDPSPPALYFQPPETGYL